LNLRERALLLFWVLADTARAATESGIRRTSAQQTLGKPKRKTTRLTRVCAERCQSLAGVDHPTSVFCSASCSAVYTTKLLIRKKNATRSAITSGKLSGASPRLLRPPENRCEYIAIPKNCVRNPSERPALFLPRLRDFRSARASTRLFWERPLVGRHHVALVRLFCEFARSIDAQSNLIGIPDHKTQKKMSVREPFARFLYYGRTPVHQKGDASGARHSAMLFLKFSLAFFSFFWK
jgi:hypothetical protein